jgi:hypothetical protein
MALANIQTVIEAYVTNLSYQSNNSPSEAKAFIAACQELIVRRPERTMIDGNMVSFSTKELKSELQLARSWLAANDSSSKSSSGTFYYDTSNIRG